MVFSDALAEEIFQTLVKLPYGSVAPLIAKIQAEVNVQMQARNQAPSPDPRVEQHPIGLNPATQPEKQPKDTPKNILRHARPTVVADQTSIS